jgi:glycosyltransferase involved in cell wall biosynthesis
MKILQVVPFFSPKFGGSVTVPYQLSKELAKKDHDVTVITSDFGLDQNYIKEIEQCGVNVIPFTTIAHFGLFIYTPTLNSWLQYNIKKYDVIHLHNFRSYQNNCVSHFALKNNVPYILQAHGSVLPFFQKKQLKLLYDYVWGEQILKGASLFIAVSNEEKSQYLQMKIPDNKIVITPNGIDLSKFEVIPPHGLFRKKYKIANEENYILYLGRLHKRKGIDFLIEGFSKIPVCDKKYRLVIAGPDDGFLDFLIKQVKQLQIEDRVIFTGMLSEEDKYKALVDADVFVNPGILEIFGLVPFEAIMSGTPVIVANDCGCGEIIEDIKGGICVKFGDISGLTERICWILEHKKESQELVRNGQRYIIEKLALSQVIDEIIQLYQLNLTIKILNNSI